MTYPGYFCGKLMISAGASREDALTAVVPFVRKKTEFWAWQLLADVFKDEPDNRLACLLRAVHCKAKEEFLGKVRLALALAYIDRNDIARAKYHLDFRCGAILGMDGVCLVRLMTGCVNRGCVRLWRMAVTALSGCT